MVSSIPSQRHQGRIQGPGQPPTFTPFGLKTEGTLAQPAVSRLPIELNPAGVVQVLPRPSLISLENEEVNPTVIHQFRHGRVFGEDGLHLLPRSLKDHAQP